MDDSVTIPIRANLYLWLLTGRSNDFFNSALNTGIVYSVSDTPPEVKEVRELLKLGETTTDFHVLAALAAARMSTAFVRILPYEQDMVFINGFLGLPGISSSHTLLPSSGHSWPSIDGGFAGAHNFTQVTFTDLGSGKAVVSTNGDYSGFTDYVLAEEDGGTFRLSFAAAPDLGIRAHFQVDAWNPGDEVAVNLSPTRYPFRAVATALNQSGVAKRLMNAEGTIQAFAESSNPARRVGMGALAIMRRMLKYVNTQQSGFSVTTTFDSDGVEPLKKLYEIDRVFSAVLADRVVDEDAPVGFDA